MALHPDARADIDRFWAMVEASADIGPGRPGGMARLTLSDDDRAMRDLFVRWCFGWILAAERVPQIVVGALTDSTESATIVLFILMAVLLVLGTFMESIAIILILAPVFVPVLREFSIDPVYFGVLLTLNLAIGANTPPLGIDLMAACRVGGIPMARAFSYLLPVLGVMLAVLILLVIFPGIVTGLLPAG